jgi:predicted nicotinamide N-methyase
MPDNAADFDIRSDASGATGALVWDASRILADHILYQQTIAARSQRAHKVLELGCGTGYLALCLAAAGTRVIATDVPNRMKNLKFNANRNKLRHAIQCLPWDWSEPPPSEIAWDEVTQCVASEVVYYDETRGAEAALARTLATVLARCRPGVETILLLRVRVVRRPSGRTRAGP